MRKILLAMVFTAVALGFVFWRWTIVPKRHEAPKPVAVQSVDGPKRVIDQNGDECFIPGPQPAPKFPAPEDYPEDIWVDGR